MMRAGDAVSVPFLTGEEKTGLIVRVRHGAKGI